MDFNRRIIKGLIVWKQKKERKPLLLRGARQVGKSTIVREFGQLFDHYVELNLERPDDAQYFDQHNEVLHIMNAILLKRGITIKEGRTVLLFIDEIQERPKAIQLLRYFYEDMPHIFVVAAGSLLEFALGKVMRSPVGRIEYLYMHPMDFGEYLGATGNEPLLNHFHQPPGSELAHSTLMQEFHTYCILGGMPAVIKQYVNDGNMAQLRIVYNSIWNTYKSDIEKYASGDSEIRIMRHILKVAPSYLDKRITFQNFGNSSYKSREVGEAFRNLDAAGLIKLIYPTTSIAFPALIDIKKAPRMQFLDTGIVNNALGIQADLLAMSDMSKAFRGALIPHVIMQEFISLGMYDDERPMFWVRDKAQSSAEIDMVYRYGSMLIPIEIKSGSTGTLKSLHQYLKVCDHHFAVRIYGGSLSIQDHKTPEGTAYKLLNLPYYLGTKIPEYIDYFVKTAG